MRHLYLIFVFLGVLAFSCEKDNSGNHSGFVYRGYPSAYYKLDSSDLQKLETEYFDLNPYSMSGLNDFGFCDLDE
jgi:hypothetical protein